jgi:hypothetical protein
MRLTYLGGKPGTVNPSKMAGSNIWISTELNPATKHPVQHSLIIPT